MITVTLFINPDDPACRQAKTEIENLAAEIEFKLVTIDIRTEPTFQEHYGGQPPVITVGPYTLRAPFSLTEVRVAIGAATDRERHLVKAGDSHYQVRKQRGQTVSGADRFSLWLTRHYMAMFNMIMLVYVGLPFLAPAFLAIGWTLPARLIYMVYKPLCHQLAYRSWFLFGEQPAYPRELAHLDEWLSYEEVTGLEPADLLAARAFTGTALTGYKVALCERDVAIYGSILLFGIIYSVTGRRIKPIKLLIWFFIGILPIGLDGFSQMPALLQGVNLSWLPVRESTPLLRTVTGILFGFTTAWYGYPYVEETMRDTRGLLLHKVAVANHSTQEQA